MKKVFKETFYFAGAHLDQITKIVFPFALMLVVIGTALDYFGGEEEEFLWLYMVAMLAIQPLFMCRLIRYMHHVVNQETYNNEVSFEDWLNLFLVYFMVGAAVLLGFLALIIPGIYLAAKFGFAEFDTVLKKRSPFDAMGDSWSATTPYIGTLFVGALIIGGAPVLIGIPLEAMSETNAELSILTSIVAELVSVISTVLVSIYFFRIYCMAQTHEKIESDDF